MRKIMGCLLFGVVSSLLVVPIAAQEVAPSVVEEKLVVKKPSLTFYFFDG